MITLLALFSLAAPAAAGTLSIGDEPSLKGKVMGYGGGPDEVNDIVMRTDGARWTSKDAASAVTAASPCSRPDGYETFDPWCPSNGLVGVRAFLGNRNDRADLSKITVPALVVGGGGTDYIATGPGQDLIDVRDGEQDYVVCGGGTDAIAFDPVDQLAADCERNSAASGGSGTQPVTLRVTVPRQRTRAVGRRGLRVRLIGGAVAVRATVVITLPRATARRLKLGRRRVRAATIPFFVGAKETRAVRIRLSRRVRRAFVRGRRAARITVKATPTADDGRRGKTVTKTPRLRR